MRRTFAIAFALLFTAMVAFGHGNLQHVIGTITTINGDSVTVETVEHQSTTVYLSDKTIFTRSGTAVKREDAKVGDRVVIHAQKQGDKLMAHTVALGVSQPTATHSHLGSGHATK